MNMVEKWRNTRDALPEDLKRRIVWVSLFLLFLNALVWIAIFVVSETYPILFGLAVVAYGFGLRHAVDADHIAAIDNTTRKLMQEGKRPAGVGLFFSLGHSTVVILLSALVAFSAAFIKNNLPGFQEIGSIVGMAVSSIFLLVIGLINLASLIEIFSVWKKTVKGENEEGEAIESSGGIFSRILRPALRLVDESWKMYFVGFLFGLGFDTASEIGLLSISAAGAASDMPILYILLLPLAFMAGMSLVDTVDSILMLGAYGWAFVKPVRKLYYNMSITLISVITALFIGGVEGLQLISLKLEINSGIFAAANSIALENMGYLIVIIFVSSWAISVFVYKFRRYELLETNI